MPPALPVRRARSITGPRHPPHLFLTYNFPYFISDQLHILLHGLLPLQLRYSPQGLCLVVQVQLRVWSSLHLLWSSFT